MSAHPKTQHDLVARVKAKTQKELQRIEDAPEMPEIPEKEFSQEAPFWDEAVRIGTFDELVPIPTSNLEEIRKASEEYYFAFHHSGPAAKITSADSLFLLVCWYKSGLNIEELAGFKGIAPSSLEKTIQRARVLMHKTLSDRWLNNPERPTPLLGSNYPYIGLLGDSTTVQIYHPAMKFNEAKQYFDGHHWIYGLKKEVAVRASAPHFAVAFLPSAPGARNDYVIHKEHFLEYEPYLRKTEMEKLLLSQDTQHSHWAILMDSAYDGNALDTPLERRIAIKKNPSSPAIVHANEELKNLRVHVECFFGRMYKLWGVIRNIYKWDHDFFDLDFENCAMLTNEHIRANQLTEEDRIFYRKYLSSRVSEAERKQAKRKLSLRKYEEKHKKRKIDEVNDVLV
jgi:hypothetical protein